MNEIELRRAASDVQELLSRGELAESYPILKALNAARPNNPTVLNALAEVQDRLLTQLQSSQPLSGALHAIAQNTFTATLLELYHRFVLEAQVLESVRWAIVGEGCGIWTLGELTTEWKGFSSEHFEIAGHGCYTTERRALEEIKLTAFDAICIDAKNAEEEEELACRLKLLMAEQNIERPVFLAHKITRGHFLALCVIDELRSCLNPRKLAVMCLALAATAGKGRAFECGAYRCGTSAFAGALYALWGDSRKFEAIDTFEGMPAARVEDGESCYEEGTFFETTLQDAEEYLKRNVLDLTVKLHKGLAQDVLDRILGPGDEVAFGLVDTDQYAGTVDCLQRLVPRLKKNGLIIVDDYGLIGVRRAVDELGAAYPDLRRHELTNNFCVLWKSHDAALFSCMGD